MADTDFSWLEWCKSPDPGVWVAECLENPVSSSDQDVNISSLVPDTIRNSLYVDQSHPLTTTYPWLKEFVDSHQDPRFNLSRQAWKENPNLTTAILRECVNGISCRLLGLHWPRVVVQENEWDMEIEEWKVLTIRDFQSHLRDLLSNLGGKSIMGWENEQPKTVTSSVHLFCMIVGCPSSNADQELFKNLNKLRDKALSDLPQPTRELQARLDDLNSENIRLKFTRLRSGPILTSLAYRRLIEQLCANTWVPQPKSIPPAVTEKWETFWANAMQSARNNPNHPLWNLQRDSTITWAQLDRAGRQLFGTLSGNIHQYPGTEYFVDLNQWANNIVVGRILQAMTPSKMNFTVGPDGQPTVKWAAEKARY